MSELFAGLPKLEKTEQSMIGLDQLEGEKVDVLEDGSGDIFSGLPRLSDSEPKQIGNAEGNRNAVSDSMLFDIRPSDALSHKKQVDDFATGEIEEARSHSRVAFTNILSSMSARERALFPGGMQHLTNDLPTGGYPVTGKAISTIGYKERPLIREQLSTLIGYKERPLIREQLSTLIGYKERPLIREQLSTLGLTKEYIKNLPSQAWQSVKSGTGGTIQALGASYEKESTWTKEAKEAAVALFVPDVLNPGKNLEEVDFGVFDPGRVFKEIFYDITRDPVKFVELDEGLTDYGREMRQEAIRKLQEITPAEQTYLQEVVTSGVTSASIAFPGMLASMVVRNPTPLLAAFGVSTYGQTYGNALDAGLSHEKAHEAAMRDAAIEVGTELIPAQHLIGLSKGTISKGLVKLVASEYAGETAATVLQNTNAYMSGIDKKPLDQFFGDMWHDLKVTWGATALGTPLQAGLARVTGKTIEAVARVKERPVVKPEDYEAAARSVGGRKKLEDIALSSKEKTTAQAFENITDEEINQVIEKATPIVDEKLDRIISEDGDIDSAIDDLLQVQGIETVETEALTELPERNIEVSRVLENGEIVKIEVNEMEAENDAKDSQAVKKRLDDMVGCIK